MSAHLTEKWDTSHRDQSHPDLIRSPLYLLSKAIGRVSITQPELAKAYLTDPGNRDQMALFTFDKSEIGIDGNVERVVSRIIKKKNKKIIFKEVSKFKVKKKSSFLMQGFMEIGATICKPTKPLCELCPINKFCKSYKNFSFLVKKNTINKKNEKFFIGFVLDQKNKLLLRNEKNFGPLKGFINIPLFKKKGQLSSVLKNISLNRFLHYKMVYKLLYFLSKSIPLFSKKITKVSLLF